MIGIEAFLTYWRDIGVLFIFQDFAAPHVCTSNINNTTSWKLTHLLLNSFNYVHMNNSYLLHVEVWYMHELLATIYEHAQAFS